MTSRTRRAPDPPLRPAYLPHQSAGGRRLPVALHRLAALRASRAGRPRRPPPADADQPHHAAALFGRDLPDEAAADSCSPSWPSRWPRSAPRATWWSRRWAAALSRPFFEGYTRKQWGLDPSAARQSGHRPGAGPAHRRRPLLPRPLPGDAARRLHADVRADARPPADRPRARHRFPRPRAGLAAPLTVYTGPIDALLRPSLRRAALSQPRLPHRDPRPPRASSRSAS